VCLETLQVLLQADPIGLQIGTGRRNVRMTQPVCHDVIGSAGFAQTTRELATQIIEMQVVDLGSCAETFPRTPG
jgi:hypothetical protein